LKKISLALSTRTRTLSLSIVGTSMGPAVAVSMQENPPAAAVSAKLADIFNASRRLMLDMDFSCRLAGNWDTGSGQPDNYRSRVQDRFSMLSTTTLASARRVGTSFTEAATLR